MRLPPLPQLPPLPPQLPLLPPLPVIPKFDPHADEGLTSHVCKVERHGYDTASVRIKDFTTTLTRSEVCRLIGQLERVLSKI